MQVIRQDADRDGVERPLPLHLAIRLPKPVDVFGQQVARSIGKGDGEEIGRASDHVATITGHTCIV